MIEYMVIDPPANLDSMTPTEVENWLNNIGKDGWKPTGIGANGKLAFWRELRSVSEHVEKSTTKRRISEALLKVKK